MPSRISMVKSSSYDLLVQYRFFVSCSGSHLHQSEKYKYFLYRKNLSLFQATFAAEQKKKKENRGRLGSSGRKERDLGRMERRTEVWVVLKKEGDLRRLWFGWIRREVWIGWKKKKKKTGKFGSGRKEGGKPGPGGKMEGSLRGLGCFFTQPDPKLPPPFCSAAVISFCFTY